MLPNARTQLLTTQTSHATYNKDDLIYSAKSLTSSSLIFLHIEQSNSKPEERRQEMQPRPRSINDDELWFRPGSGRHEEVARQEQESSAYQYTTSRHIARRSVSPSRYPQIPSISTPSQDKPLPPSPESHKKKNKPASLRSLLSRRSSHETVYSAHLQPDSAHSHQRSSSKDGKLSPEPLYPLRTSSLSMPNTPVDASSSSSDMARANSASPNYPATIDYQRRSLVPAPLQTKPRSTSTETYFDTGAPLNVRAFPETGRQVPAMANDPRTGGPRPHTWLSPTEPFNNDNEFHLFAEATSGLPDGFDPMSPNEAPRLQASLFARGSQNDTIPLPFQDPSALGRWEPRPDEFIPRQRPRELREPSISYPSYAYNEAPESPPREVVPLPSIDDVWSPRQPPREFATSSSALPDMDLYDQPSYSPGPSGSAFPRRASYDRPPSSPMPANLVAVNMELERLGVEDEQHDDDELPNYAQSQAEMHEKKRVEAAARARELESRWNSSRGWRGR
ncbi:hypothetical protein P280DRAFT_333841 [Massarina eburnea CBS 473.64]|uniref:Uncharacterized protein n=1 Tax=Massarina eburnea CBS 473.64 TaxID=1395130 RepID=A0A6A6RZD3_9PLEO|nr:hypothetical protein P280DRAFT_333841 [Massarina eburnea CBS 473.64]